MALIYFMRHGQTDFNAAKRIQGNIEVPINATGRTQARRNGGVLNEIISDKSRFDFVASPLLRTRQTMEIVREAMGLPAQGYRLDERLHEVRFGDWGGMTMEEIAQRDTENFLRREADVWNVAPPGGECFRTKYERTVAWLSEVAADTVVVAHGGTSRSIRGYLLKLPPEEIVHLDVPQDRVMMIEDGKISWL